MPDLQLTLEAEPDRLDGLRVWIVRGTVAAGFLVIGAKKFDEASIWVKLFAQLGAGDWLRDVTGGLQILGALLLLVPWTARIGAAILTCTVIGAMFAHLFVLGTGIGGAIIPALVLGFTLAAGWTTFVHQHPTRIRPGQSPDGR